MRLIWNGKVLVVSALARALNRVGYKTHVSHVSRVLHGQRDASKEFIQALQKVLGLPKKETEQFVRDCVDAIQHVESLPKLIPED